MLDVVIKTYMNLPNCIENKTQPHNEGDRVKTHKIVLFIIQIKTNITILLKLWCYNGRFGTRISRKKLLAMPKVID